LAGADPIRLNGQDIKTALPGSVLKLDTPLYTVVPIAFGGDGYMSGDAGQLASVLGAQKDRGRWWLAGDRLCYKWFRWFDAEEHCATIERDGPKIYWSRDDGESGTATLEEHRKTATAQVASINPSQARSKVAVASAGDPNSDAKRQRLAAKTSVDPIGIKPPVLVKLPTLAVRPAKTTAVLTSAE
jgi:hypothetical protein